MITAGRSAVILTGIQASGKSAFYRQLLAATHARISLDELKTRSREKLMLDKFIKDGTSFVIDNTNPAAEDRVRYIEPAKKAGYLIAAVYFDSTLKECLTRNRQRQGSARVPEIAVITTAKKITEPELCEGFDMVSRVRIADGLFEVV